MPDEHIAATGVNTFGTTFDLMVRPSASSDPRCDEIIRQVVESVMVAFPAAAQQSIEDAVVAAIAAADGRFASLNLNKISSDLGNLAETGSDGGIYVPRLFAQTTANTVAGVIGAISLPLPNFPDNNYHVSVEANGDPGANFRWWITNKDNGACGVSFCANNPILLTIIAHG